MKFHKNIAIVALLVMVAGNMQGMEQQAFPFTSLPRELQREVMVIALNNEINSLPNIPESLKIAAEKIRDLAIVNKAFNNAINQPHFCLLLIKDLAKRFDETDADAAEVLGTRCAQERFKLQKEFIDYIRDSKENFSIAAMEKFIKRGVDLNFDGRSYKFGHTPLAEAVWLGESPDMVYFLIKKGADVNYGTSGYAKPLYFAIHAHNMEKKSVIAQYKERQVKIIKMLLEAGADPNTMTDNEVSNRKLQEKDVFKEAQGQLNR